MSMCIYMHMDPRDMAYANEAYKQLYPLYICMAVEDICRG